MNIGPNATPVYRLLRLMTILGLVVLACGQVWTHSRPLQIRHDGRLNPWVGLSGCLSMTGPGGQVFYFPQNPGTAFSCASFLGPDAMPLDGETIGLGRTIRNRLRPVLASPLTANPDKVDIDRTNLAQLPGRGPVSAGGDVRLTLDMQSQSRARLIVGCMTGNTAACNRVGMDASRWQHMEENAAARSMAMVELDVETGAIKVLVSAASRGFLADAAGAHITGTPLLSHARRKREDWLEENLALFQEAKLGSLNKPWMAIALMQSGPPWFDIQSEKDRQWVVRSLRSSDTTSFISRVLGKDLGFPTPCLPVENLAQAAHDLGWDGSVQDVFLGGNTGNLVRSTGRIYMHTVSDALGKKIWQTIPSRPFDLNRLSQSAKRNWSRPSGAYEALVISELWGAGSSSASPFGVATAYARLAAAANGQKEVKPAHLVSEIRAGQEIIRPAAAHSIAIDPDHARRILDALSHTQRAGKDNSGAFWAGTAFSACTAVFDNQTCNRMDFISVKTGTPGFLHDRLTWQERASQCQANQAKIADLKKQEKPVPQSLRIEQARCVAVPYKWAVMLIRSDKKADGPYEKVIVILSERNWRKDNGFVDSKEEKGSPNISAEAAFWYLREMLTDEGNDHRLYLADN